MSDLNHRQEIQSLMPTLMNDVVQYLDTIYHSVFNIEDHEDDELVSMIKLKSQADPMPVTQEAWVNVHLKVLQERIAVYAPIIAKLYLQVYGLKVDFYPWWRALVLSAIDAYMRRSPDLLQRDESKSLNFKQYQSQRSRSHKTKLPWYSTKESVGAALYVDLFCDTLQTLQSKIDYWKDLGVTYLHLMPILEAREGESDGGYAVKDYRAVDSKFGSLDDLQNVIHILHQADMSLVLDFVFNHTADDHAWAKAAQQGIKPYDHYYYTSSQKDFVDQYTPYLRDIFPSVRKGCFTWHDVMQKWIWTTFNSYQWDLNYSQPSVLLAMIQEVLFLANIGVDVLRLDAVAFIWKQLGTDCENLPQAHWIIRIFNAVLRIAAPSVVFKSEAIVHPDDVVKYIGLEECQISYNPTFMALCWESLATRRTQILHQSLWHRQRLPINTAWVNYLRCHDDIGWSFANDDAWYVGVNPQHHRLFLNQFYTGQFDGSFAKGVPFQFNPINQDMRICGTMASLIGIEQGIESHDPMLLDMALRRTRMIYAVLMSVSGLPLLYMGEEWALMNDYSYQDKKDQKEDSRWVHRVAYDWNHIEQLQQFQATLKQEEITQSTLNIPVQIDTRSQYASIWVNTMLKHIIGIRKSTEAFDGQWMQVTAFLNPHVLSFIRRGVNETHANVVWILANFSEDIQYIDLKQMLGWGLGSRLRDRLTLKERVWENQWRLEPYAVYWLENI